MVKLIKIAMGIALIMAASASIYNAYRTQGIDFSVILLFLFLGGLGILLLRGSRNGGRALRSSS